MILSVLLYFKPWHLKDIYFGLLGANFFISLLYQRNNNSNNSNSKAVPKPQYGEENIFFMKKLFYIVKNSEIRTINLIDK